MKSLHRKLFNTQSLKQFSRLLSSNHDNYYKNSNDNQRKIKYLSIGGTTMLLLSYNLYERKKRAVFAKEDDSRNKFFVGLRKDGLPLYSLEEVRKHTTKESRIWVTYNEGVYDITEFIEGHPGGDQILMAAGNSVEPFWLLYRVHENEHVYKILETYRIGNLSTEEAQSSTEDMEDPYRNEPKRHSALKPGTLKPFNAESSPVLLVESPTTPNELFYVRNHLPVPDIDPETYELEIEVEGYEKTFTFSLDDLKKFPKHTVNSTIMCAGFRRSEMSKVKPVKGLGWSHATAGNAIWAGVKLKDVIESTGIQIDRKKYKHVQFEGADFDVTGKMYGASIPIWKVLEDRGDVILAYEMNGVPIPRDHGFPIRAIVPGTVGARNVKWLAKIVVAENESDSHWQQNDYKGFSPSTDWHNVDYTKSPSIQELPVNSAICFPEEGQTVQVEDGNFIVKGFAWSGGGNKIVRVDITIDEGKTWHVADFTYQDGAEPPQHWSWTLWSCKIPVDKSLKNVEIWAKAVDSNYNTQPESFANIWNLRGVLSNAYHRVKVNLKY